MIVFIGMETSGEFRRRFEALGHLTISADLLPAEDGAQFPNFNGGGHIQDDIFIVLDYMWRKGIWPDLGIFHPDCTFMTNSAAWAFADPDFIRYPGVGYHQQIKPGTLVGAPRRAARQKALDGVRHIRALSIRRKVVENPIGAIGKAICKASQTLQPYQFGDDASKATCLWFFDKEGESAPEMRVPIDPAKRINGRLVPREDAMGKSDKRNDNRGPSFIERWSNQTDTGQNRISPADDRWKDRSRTFPGLADAAARHWHQVIMGVA